MAEIQDYKYAFKHPKSLSDRQFGEVSVERDSYYGANLPNETGGLEFSRSGSRRTWNNPNKGPRRSRRARPEVITATRKTDGTIDGHIYIADDASASLDYPFIRGLERTAKLWLPHDKARQHRPRWIREVIFPVETPEMAHVLAALATHPDAKGHPDQPVSCYPFDGEDVLMDLLTEWGFAKTSEEQITPPGFDDGIWMFRYEAPSMSVVHENAMSVAGVGNVVRTNTPKNC